MGTIDNVDAKIAQQGGRTIQRLATAPHGGMARIVEAPSMIAVPVRAVRDVHVDPDKRDPRDPKLHKEVQRLEAGIASRPDHSGFIKQEIVAFWLKHPHVMDIAVASARFGILRDLQSLELGDAVTPIPPQPIAGIEDISPRTEPPGLVDRYKSSPPLPFLDLDPRCGWARSDEDGALSAPVSPPTEGKGPCSTALFCGDGF